MTSHPMDWNEVARSYSTVENTRKPNVFPFLREQLERSKPGRLLDFGCGSGVFALMCRDLAGAIFNYDISAEMRSLASEAASGIANISVLSTLDELQPESIDVITMNAVWMCLPSATACADALRSMNRLLRTGGQLFASFTHPCFRDRKFSAYETNFDQRKYLVNATSFRVRVFDRKKSVELIDTHWNFSAVTEQLVNGGFLIKRIHELPDIPGEAGETLGSPWVVLEAVKTVRASDDTQKF